MSSVWKNASKPEWWDAIWKMPMAPPQYAANSWLSDADVDCIARRVVEVLKEKLEC